MLSVVNLTKVYKIKGGNKVAALNGVSIDFPEKGMVFLLGKSGSGKSTLLNTIGGLDKFDSGEIIIKGKSSKEFKQSDFDSYRNTFIGFIFQEYNILEEFSVGKNLALALELQGKKANKAEVEKLLDQVDLTDYYKRKPNQLSGGQKQRVAIARALIKDPEIIMADEPTGALDSKTGKQVMDTLKKLSQTKLVIIVSHDRDFAEIYGDRIIELKDGKIISDQTKKEVAPQKSESGVSFIDNKIIHIKKGQKLTKEDLIKINKVLVNNKEEDTIISIDKKSNTEFKRVAAITDDGNREVFKETKESDIVRKKHDPEDLVLIRSKLKMKDAVKMGANSLKHKPIRLLIAVLLACVSFTLFGVSITMASWDQTKSIYESTKELNTPTFAISKSVYNEDGYRMHGDILLNNDDIALLEKENSNYKFYPVAANSQYYSVESGSEQKNSNSLDNSKRPLLAKQIAGAMAVDQQTLQNLHLTLVEGSLPTQADEICVSENIRQTINSMFNASNLNEEICGKNISFKLTTWGEDLTYKIVGVIKDSSNTSKYEQVNESSNQLQQMMYESEFTVLMQKSTFNLIYTTQTAFNTLASSFNISTSLYVPRGDGENEYITSIYNPGSTIKNHWYYDSATSTQLLLNTYDYRIKENEIVFKSGETKDTFTGNKAIISKDHLMHILDTVEDDVIMQKIDEGLTIKFYYDYKGLADALTVNVVGVSTSSWECFLTDDAYNKTLNGYKYVQVGLKGNEQDKSLIGNIVENSNAVRYALEFSASNQFENFGNMIDSMKQPFLYTGIVLAVFAGLILMNFISTSISYKKREIGILRAVGARGKDVFAIFFSESFIICIINFIISAITTGVCCFFINRALLQELGIAITLLSYGVLQIAVLFALSLAVAWISSFLPVFKASRKNPIDSINNR